MCFGAVVRHGRIFGPPQAFGFFAGILMCAIMNKPTDSAGT